MCPFLKSTNFSSFGLQLRKAKTSTLRSMTLFIMNFFKNRSVPKSYVIMKQKPLCLKLEIR